MQCIGLHAVQCYRPVHCIIRIPPFLRLIRAKLTLVMVGASGPRKQMSTTCSCMQLHVHAALLHDMFFCSEMAATNSDFKLLTTIFLKEKDFK